MSSPFQDALREQLRAAAIRDLERPQRRRGPIAAAIVAAIAAAAAAVALLNPSPAAADVEVSIREGIVEVRLTDLDSTVAEVQDAMADAGLRARVLRVPVGPSLVGRFVQVTFEQATERQVETFSSDGVGFEGFRLEEGWAGNLVIQFGEAAGPGETYGSGSDAFAVGEPLRCSGLLGATLAAARAQLGDLTVTVLPEGFVGAPIPIGAPELTPYASQHVASARMSSATDVLVSLSVAPPTTREEGC